ncbi:hypothetical protein BT96DRAFT_979442 [Gymnopus androsaceus JB14]|uniref:Uncharacterized protein n=1 Tax=Gymnopus androsaceus JB14 TaxID=1447944 RepID=A0A6A4H4P6_9AGAR|nr:hypothetical protein BT96DRAFT_979442 [Gymnopus androsaceus JB14]
MDAHGVWTRCFHQLKPQPPEWSLAFLYGTAKTGPRAFSLARYNSPQPPPSTARLQPALQYHYNWGLCFLFLMTVLPDQPYQYRLIPGKDMKDPIPLFALDSSTGTFRRFNYLYNLPLLTLDCYPIRSVMHNDFVMPYSRPIHGLFVVHLFLASRMQM